MIDASGLLVLPGLIDSHVHFRQPGQACKEGVANGSRAALKGGVTTVLDMPNNRPPCTTAARLEAKRRIFRASCLVNWGLHLQAGVTPPRSGVLPPISPTVLHSPRGGGPPIGVTPPRSGPQPPVASAKVYMAKSSGLPAVLDEEVLRGLLETFPVVTVHAEDERCFRPGEGRPHHEARPVEAIRSALAILERALIAASRGRNRAQRPRLVLCHVSTGLEVRWLERKKMAGFDVWGETCPHYLLLTQDDYLRDRSRLKVNPPLRTADDRAAVRQGLADGTIDFLSTDHAPHTPAEKTAGDSAPSGIPSVEWLAPLAYALLGCSPGLRFGSGRVEGSGGAAAAPPAAPEAKRPPAGWPAAAFERRSDGGGDWKRFLDATCGAASRCFGIPGRDGIQDGNAADLVLFDPAGLADRTNVITRAGYCPYRKQDMQGAVAATIVRGEVKYRDGRVVSSTPGMEVWL